MFIGIDTTTAPGGGYPPSNFSEKIMAMALSEQVLQQTSQIIRTSLAGLSLAAIVVNFIPLAFPV
jgi:hypothetical protein